MGLHFCTQLIKPIVGSLEHMKGQTRRWWLVDASESTSVGSLLTLEHFHPGSCLICRSSSQRPERGCWGREGVASTGTCRSGTDTVARLLSWAIGASHAARSSVPAHVFCGGREAGTALASDPAWPYFLSEPHTGRQGMQTEPGQDSRHPGIRSQALHPPAPVCRARVHLVSPGNALELLNLHSCFRDGVLERITNTLFFGFQVILPIWG